MLRLLAPGDRVLLPDDAYGGTFRLVAQVLAPAGVRVRRRRSHRPRRDSRARGTTAPRWSGSRRPPIPRSPSSTSRPSRELAHARGARVVVDNTFATPYLQRPLELGADIVVHSATKYLGGHSDVVGGCAVTSDPEVAERIGFLQNATGAVPSPFDCYLVLRGIKTLAVRMERHCTNAQAVATMLVAASRGVTRALPGPRRPPRARHRGDARCATSAAWCRSSPRAGRTPRSSVVAKTRLFTLAESLGGVESLIEHPARMTHASVEGSAARGRPRARAPVRRHRDHRRPRRRPQRRARLALTPQPTGSPYIWPSGSEISSSRSPSGPWK